MTPGDLTSAIRAAVEHHEPDSGGQWYVDDLCIDCDAEEFWDVVLRAVCEAAGTGITVAPRVLRDVTLISWGPDLPGEA